MAFTERRAQEPQQLFRAAAKLASFGLILPEMFGSLADSALTRPPPELPRVLFSTICGNSRAASGLDRKSTRLNSSHGYISYAVFCLKKKNIDTIAHNNHNTPNISYYIINLQYISSTNRTSNQNHPL